MNASNDNLSSIYGRFFHLLVTLLLFFLLYAVLVHHEMGVIVVELSFSLMLLASVRAASEKRWTFIAACVLFVLAIVSRWSADFINTMPLLFISNLIIVINLSFIAGVILTSILKKKDIVLDDVYGAICVYLLVGLIFAFLYFSIETYHAGAFNFTFQQAVRPEVQLLNLVYFSFITLTTVGYGDIVPLSLLAKSLAYLEAVIGQVYLAVLVARLIAIYVTKLSLSRNRSDEDDAS